MFKKARLLWLPLLCAAFLSTAHATYSIVACDPKTRECGVAVQTNNLAVGASVPYAQAGVGALASQFETNPMYGPRGLALMAGGKGPEETLQQLLREDGNFEGEGIEARQVGMVAVDGRAAFYTGKEAADSNWAGARSGAGYSVQGNGLAGPQVVDAMERAFLDTPGSLSDRLLAALVAGDAAGGQKTGRESAALLVRTPDGFPLDVDLRVDHSANPVAELVKLYNLQSARQQLIEAGIAANRGQFNQAKASLVAAVARANDWPRVTIRAAKTAEQIEEPLLALQYITMAFSQNPAWAQEEIGAGDYAEVGASPLFHRWVSREQEQRALEAYRKISDPKQVSPEERVDLSRKLLEVGHPQEALVLLRQPDGAGQTIQFDLLRAQAYSAEGNDTAALEQCMHAQKQDPQNLRVRLRIAQLKQNADAR